MHIKPTRVFVPPSPSNAKPPPPKAKRLKADRPIESAETPAPKADAVAKAPPPPPKPQTPPAPIIPPIEAGSDCALVVEKARMVSLKKLGESVEVTFKLDVEPRQESTASGQFPLAGKGLAVLVSAALGETLGEWDAGIVPRLVGKRIVADVAHTGAAVRPVAIVRNIRAAV